ncbi:unnamed protein product [Discula destructiva]
MITPSPQVNKSFDPPLAARPIPIRTGSLSPTPSPARSSRAGAGAVRLRQATSILGMRGMQGISHLRSLTMSQRGVNFGGGSKGSSGDSNCSSGASSRKGSNQERPIVISMPFFDPGEGRDTDVANNVPPRFGAVPRAHGLPVSLPTSGARAPTARAPLSDADNFDRPKARSPTIPEGAQAQADQPISYNPDVPLDKAYPPSSSSRESFSALSPIEKRAGGVELWDVALDSVDQDALQDALLDRDHPNPLNSNPTSERDEDEPTTPWVTDSFTPEFGIERPTCNTLPLYWSDVSSPSRKRRFRSIALTSVPTAQMFREPVTPSSSASSLQNPSALSCACAKVLPQLHHEIDALRAGNSALVTLKAAHEETITLLHDKIRNHDTSGINQLAWQAQANKTEQLRLVENFCAEMSSRNKEIQSLKEDKWYLMGEIAQLEKSIATMDCAVGCEEKHGELDETVPQGDSIEAETEQENDHDDIRATIAGTPANPRIPFLNRPANCDGEMEAPGAILSSLFPPRVCSSASNRSLFAATPAPSDHEAPYTRTSRYADSENCSWNYQAHRSGQFERAPASQVQSVSGAVHHARYSRESQIVAAQIVLAAKAEVEQSLHDTQEKLIKAEAHCRELQAKLADQNNLLPQSSHPPFSMSSAFMPIPELPVLTYDRSSAVWNDRLVTSFKYLGLLDFIQRDVPRPETSTWDATEVADWSSRRLRAVVLLKQAVDDQILEDVLHMSGRKVAAPGQPLEDPHHLFTTITCLRRIISSSATDLSWLDRIEDTDFTGLEGFTSLVLCIVKRHRTMYGTSADHYDALLPKLEETKIRLFPELEDSIFAIESAGSLPRSWLQLSIWMAKVVKRRQISGEC